MSGCHAQKNAVVINLTRFGDLIQSQPVLGRLKDLGFTTHLVCLDNFLQAARLLQGADHIHPFPGARLLALLDSTWPGAVQEFKNWVHKSAALGRFDLAVNLTPSLSSRLLCWQYQAPENRGFFLDEMGFGCYSGSWAAFLQASSAHRGCSPFNIVDLFVRAAHLGPDKVRLKINRPSKNRISDMRSLLVQESGGSDYSGFIAFQLGASDDKRRWPVEYFALLGDMLCRDLNLCPVLLGSPGEKQLAEKYRTLARTGYADLTGRTDLEELSAALCSCSLLVTNDTGTMHLAAGLGVKSLAFFLATAQPWDTGPYLDNCLCLEPGVDCHPCSFSHRCQTGLHCRKIITPQLVYQAAQDFLSRGQWPEIETSQARIRLTVLKDNLFSLKPLNSRAMDSHSRWMQLQKHFFRLFLDKNDISPPLKLQKPDEEFSLEIVEHMSRLASILELAGQQAVVLNRTAPPSMKKKFLSTWQRLSHELSQSPYIPVLGLLWTYQTQASSADLMGISKLCSAYSDLFQGISHYLRN